MRNSKRVLAFVLLYLFLVTSILQGVNFKVSAEENKTNVKSLKGISGQVVLKLKDEKSKDYKNIIKKNEGKILKEDGKYILVAVPEGQENSFINVIKKNRNIEYAEVNALGIKQGSIVNDPLIGSEFYFYYNEVMEAWPLLPENSPQVTIALVDSGVESSHEDLTGRILPGKNIIDDNEDTTDNQGHGTQIAGIIAANTNNSKGIASITGNSNVRILPVKVLDNSGSGTTFNISQGIRYAADNGAKVINVSINGEGYSQIINDAIDYASSKGAVIVVSAGDFSDYADNYWPANCSNAIAVKNNDGYNSNYGHFVSFAASGEGMTTNINNEYTYVYGSSYSAGVVSGIVALAFEKFPNYTKDQIENIIKKSTDISNPTGALTYKDNYSGYGNINVLKMFNTENDLIEIVNPESHQNVKEDCSLKFKVIDPLNFEKAEVYINDGVSPITNISSVENQTAYAYDIPLSSLVDGANKVLVKAYKKDGTTVTDYRYINVYKNNDRYINLNIKGIDGNNLPKGTKVLLRSISNDINTNDTLLAGAITDENGNAVFYNTSKDMDYTVSIIYGTTEPVIYKENINGSGSYNLTMTGLKKIPIAANDINGNALLGSNLVLNGKNYGNIFNSTGIGYIYASSSADAEILVTNKNGYVYKKSISSFQNIESITFNLDSTMRKIDVTNYYDEINSNISLLGISDFDYYLSAFIDLNPNKYFYVPNDLNYDYSYSFDEYSYRYNSSNNNSSLNFGELSLNNSLESNYSGESFDFSTYIGDENAHRLELDNLNLNIKIYDSMNNVLDSTKYSLELFNDLGNYEYNITFNNTTPFGKYYVEASSDLGKLGIKTSEKTEINYSNGTSDNSSNLTVKGPLSGEALNDVHFEIYDKTNHDWIFGNSIITNGNSGIYAMDASYFNSNYEILISGTYLNKEDSFFYKRDMPAAPGDFTIDNSSGNCKKVSIKLDNEALNSKIFNENSELYVDYLSIPNSSSISGCIDETGITSMWVEDGDYSLTLTNGVTGYILSGQASFNDSSRIINLRTDNLGGVKINVDNVDNISDVSFEGSYDNPDSISIHDVNNKLILISSSLNFNINRIYVNSYDEILGRSYSYDYNTDITPVQNENKEINMTDFIVGFDNSSYYLDLPNYTNIGVNIKSGGQVLTDMSSYSDYNFMEEVYSAENLLKLQLYNGGSLIKTYSNDLNFYGFSDVSLSQGIYDMKLSLCFKAKNVTYTDAALNVITENLQKIKIMNPFDLSQAAVNAEADTPDGNYYTDKYGYIYLRKGSITDPSKVKIQVKSTYGTAIFSCSGFDFSSSEVIINKSINELSMINVKPLSANGKVTANNGSLKLTGINYDSNLYLDENGEWNNLYIEQGAYNLVISQDSNKNSYYITKEFDTSTGTDVLYDNINLQRIIYDSAIDQNSIIINVNQQYMYYTENGIYVSPGLTVNYNYNDSNTDLGYSNSFTTEASDTDKIISIGKNIVLQADSLNYDLSPLGEFKYNISLTDECGDDIEILDWYEKHPSLKAEIIKDGVSAGSFDCTETEYKTYSFNLPELAAGDFTVQISMILPDLTTIKSNVMNAALDLSNYNKIIVKDTYGNLADGGEISLSYPDYNVYNITSAGIVYIPKNIFTAVSDIAFNLTANCSGNKDKFYFEGQLYSDTAVITPPSDLVRIDVRAVNAPLNISENGRIIITGSLYLKTFEFKGDTDNYLWINNGVYDFELNFNAGSDSYILRNYDIDTEKTNVIESDCKDVSLIDYHYNGDYNLNTFSIIDTNLNPEGAVYISKNKLYKDISISYTECDDNYNYINDRYSSYSINNLYAKDDITTIYFGKEKYTMVSNGEDFSIPSCLRRNDYQNSYIKLMDENGNLNNIPGLYVTLHFKQNGAEMGQVSFYSNGHYQVPDLPAGEYQVYVTTNYSNITAKEEYYNVNITDDTVGTINVSYAQAGCFRLKVTDQEGNLVFNSSDDQYNYYLPKSMFTNGKTYDFYSSTGDIYKISAAIDESTSSIDFNEAVKLSSLEINEAPYSKGKLYKGNIYLNSFELDKDGHCYMGMDTGTYRLVMFAADPSTKKSYLFDRDINVSGGNNVITLDNTNMSLVSLNNGFSKAPYNINYKASKLGEEISQQFNYQNLDTNEIYIDKGNYQFENEFKFSEQTNDISRSLKGTYDINAAGDLAQFNYGSNLKIGAIGNQTPLNVGSSIDYVYLGLKDGSTSLTGFDKSDFTLLSFNLMHGDKVIKKFTNVDSSISGDCTVSLNLYNNTIGNVKSENINIIVNNPTCLYLGDINLDKIINLYDLVMISKDMGKQKGISPSYDGRCDVDNTDGLNIIDIMDIAQESRNYNLVIGQ